MARLSDGVQRTVLDNGFTLLVKENHNAGVAAIFAYVKAGYFDESDDVVGISHLIEHMFFKGTQKRGVGELAKQTKALGGYLNASTIYDHTMYYTVVPSAHFAEGLEIQADALLNSTFDAEELVKETEVVIQEAKRKLDNPGAVVREKLFETAFNQHRIRRWRIGTEAGLRRLTRDDFLTFHNNLYRPENIILVVAGDVDSEQVSREVLQHYGAFDRGTLGKDCAPAEPAQQKFRYGYLEDDIQHGYVSFGFHVPGSLQEDSYALEILAFVLGYGRSSRLNRFVKEEKQLAHSVSAHNYTLADFGIFSIDAISDAGRLRQAASAIMEQVAGVLQQPVTSGELEKARNMLESMTISSMETVAGHARVLAAYEALGGFELIDGYLEKLYQVTAGDISRVAERYLHPENCTVFEYVSAASGLGAISPDRLAREFRRSLDNAIDNRKPRPDRPVPALNWHVRANHSSPAKGLSRYAFESGATLLVREDHHLPVVSVGIYAPGGRTAESKANAGISGLTARMALKGAGHLSAAEIASQIEGLGTSIDFSADPDYFGCSLDILAKHFERGWEILTEILCHPTFPDDELGKEKEQTIARARRLQDDMFSYPIQLFSGAMFADHPYGLPPLGRDDTISSISRDNLKEWHGRHFLANRLTIVAVGDTSMDEMIDKAGQLLPNLKSGLTVAPPSAPAWPKQMTSVVEEREKQQTALAIGFPAPAFIDRDYSAIRILQNIVSGLGGRFFEELRGRKSLAYTVSSYLISRQLGGAFVTYIATSPGQEEKARQGLLAEFRKVLDNQITREEFERARRYTVGTHQMGLETCNAQMAQYAHHELIGGGAEDLHQVVAELERVSADEMAQAAQKYFNEECPVEGIVRGTP